jgi:glyoxylase-like metal-dependent hydrolase (beta-lactamase superfamily II)
MLHRSIKLNDNLYVYLWQGRGNNCNTCLLPNVLRGELPHAIIDPGHIVNELGETCLNSLISSMEKDGFKAEEIGLIINTHTHPDHCEANDVLVSRSKGGKAIITLSKEEDEYWRTVGEKLYALFEREPPQFEPFFYLAEGNLKLGKEAKVNFQVLATPGHSPGSMSLYCPESRVLIVGDVIFFGGIGRTDLPGGSMSVLKQSIEKLAELDIECIIPGHSTELGDIIQGKSLVERNFQAVKLLV